MRRLACLGNRGRMLTQVRLQFQNRNSRLFEPRLERILE